MHRTTAAALVTLLATTAGAAAQTVQVRAADGRAFVPLPDTGGIAHAVAALARSPDDPQLLLALGLQQAAIRQYREAIETFSIVLRRDPDNVTFLRWRGHRLLSVREFERALADLERGASLDSTCYGCWYHLGVTRYVRGEFGQAADAFQRGLPFAPNAGERAGSVDWLWCSLSRAGRGAEARAALAMATDSLLAAANNAYVQRLRLYQGRFGPGELPGPGDTGDVAIATLNYGLGNWYLLRGDVAHAHEAFQRAVASGGWPAFGFIAAEQELSRMR